MKLEMLENGKCLVGTGENQVKSELLIFVA